jgi:hypothetical protein
MKSEDRIPKSERNRHSVQALISFVLHLNPPRLREILFIR